MCVKHWMSELVRPLRRLHRPRLPSSPLLLPRLPLLPSPGTDGLLMVYATVGVTSGSGGGAVKLEIIGL